MSATKNNAAVEKLVPADLTMEHLNLVAQKTAGKLGMYTQAEFDALMEAVPEGWTFRYRPSNMDKSVGLLKLAPTNPETGGIMDMGRAMEIVRNDAEYSKYSTYNLIGFVRHCKRIPGGMVWVVQKFLLDNHDKAKFADAPNSEAAFLTWLVDNNIDISPIVRRKNLIEAVMALAPSVNRILTRNEDRHRKANAQKKRRKQKSGSKKVASTEAVGVVVDAPIASGVIDEFVEANGNEVVAEVQQEEVNGNVAEEVPADVAEYAQEVAKEAITKATQEESVVEESKSA